MPVAVSLKQQGVSRSSYFRWKQQESWKQEPSKPAPPVQAFEALPEEKQAVVKYALDHPGIRHRELSVQLSFLTLRDMVARLSPKPHGE